MYNKKRLIGELLGAAIAVIWICFVFFIILFGYVLLFLAIAVSLTILLGVLSGGFIKISKKDADPFKWRQL